METSVKISVAEKEGSRLLNTNHFLKDLCILMKSSGFAQFHDAHFHDWTDIQISIFYMKLYTTISFEYKNCFKEEISDELMIYMLHKIMTNFKSRHIAYDLFYKYKNQFGHKSIEGFRKLFNFQTLKIK